MKQPWRNRIIGHGEEAPDQLAANPRNWRIHPKSQQDALAGVIRDVGLVQTVLVNQATGFVVDGHLRVSLALRENQPTIPVTYVDLSEDEEALILATFDPIGALAGTDAAQLDALLREVSTDDAAVQQLLDDVATKAGIVPGVVAGDGGDEFDATPEEGPTRVQPGELWIIGGKHRLICGDCTDPAVVGRLMGGEKAALCATDPPYNVNIDYGQQVNDKKSDEEYEMFTRSWLRIAQTHSARQIVTPGTCNLQAWLRWFEPAWVAPRILSFSHVNGTIAHLSSWEPIFFFGRGWGKRRANDIFEYGVHFDKTAVGHPVPKPVAMWVDFLDHYSDAADAVYDPFLGSGTTLIAAHRTGRRCYGCEIEPRYCDVILRRAEAECLTVERAE